MKLKVINCCKIAGIDTSSELVRCVYLCNRNPVDGIECRHRPMANVNGDWCDYIKIVKAPDGKIDLATCNCRPARKQALNHLGNALLELEEFI